MKKRYAALVLGLLLLLTAAGCAAVPDKAGSGKDLVSTVETVTSNGVECYRTDGVCYPAVFGEPQLTSAELTALLDDGDTLEMAMTVNTVPDALRLLRLRQQTGEDIDNQGAEDTLLRGGTQPYGWVEALLYLLSGDYEESGRIDLNAPGNYYGLCAVKQDGLYYAFDPFEIRGDRWIAFSDVSFADADAQKLADTLRKTCDYSPFTEGVYEVNTFTLPDKETWALEKAFKQREYTDEEIQQLASAGLTLEEAADKLHFIEDAALFLRASGYRIDEEDAHFLQGRYVNFNLNPGCYIGDYDWNWGLPAD